MSENKITTNIHPIHQLDYFKRAMKEDRKVYLYTAGLTDGDPENAGMVLTQNIFRKPTDLSSEQEPITLVCAKSEFTLNHLKTINRFVGRWMAFNVKGVVEDEGKQPVVTLTRLPILKEEYEKVAEKLKAGETIDTVVHAIKMSAGMWTYYHDISLFMPNSALYGKEQHRHYGKRCGDVYQPGQHVAVKLLDVGKQNNLLVYPADPIKEPTLREKFIGLKDYMNRTVTGYITSETPKAQFVHLAVGLDAMVFKTESYSVDNDAPVVVDKVIGRGELLGEDEHDDPNAVEGDVVGRNLHGQLLVKIAPKMEITVNAPTGVKSDKVWIKLTVLRVRGHIPDISLTKLVRSYHNPQDAPKTENGSHKPFNIMEN